MLAAEVGADAAAEAGFTLRADCGERGETVFFFDPRTLSLLADGPIGPGGLELGCADGCAGAARDGGCLLAGLDDRDATRVGEALDLDQAMRFQLLDDLGGRRGRPAPVMVMISSFEGQGRPATAALLMAARITRSCAVMVLR